MFDTQHPIEISGIVKEFRYVNPHSVWIVEVRTSDGVVRDWTLEGPAPGIMARQGGHRQQLQAWRFVQGHDQSAAQR
jgi:hypothetical protein